MLNLYNPLNIECGEILKDCSRIFCYCWMFGLNKVSYSPGECKPGECLHHTQAEVSFSGIVLQGHVQGVSKDVFYLVAVHYAHPLAPERRTRSLQQIDKNVTKFSVFRINNRQLNSTNYVVICKWIRCIDIFNLWGIVFPWTCWFFEYPNQLWFCMN